MSLGLSRSVCIFCAIIAFICVFQCVLAGKAFFSNVKL